MAWHFRWKNITQEFGASFTVSFSTFPFIHHLRLQCPLDEIQILEEHFKQCNLLSEAAGLKHFVHHRGAWWHQVHFQLCVFPYDKRWHTSTDASQSDIISVLAQWVSHLKWMSPWSALNIRRSFYSSPWRDPMWTRGRLVQVHVFLWHAWNYDFFLSSYRHLLGKTNQNSWELWLMRFSLEQVHLWSSVS